MAKVVLGVGVLGIGDESLQQNFGVEDVNAHRGVHAVGVEGRAEGGGGGFFLEAQDLARGSDLDDAELLRLFRRTGQRGQRDLGILLLVVGEHTAVVHLVDVVAGEDDHVLWLFAADGIDVLVNGIGVPHVPVGAGALHGGQEFKELAQFLGYNPRPAFTDVAVEREGLVLGENVNLAQAGVDAVGKGDVDDAVVSAKGHGRFGAIAGKREEPFSLSARKQYSKCVFHIRLTLPSSLFLPGV